MQHKRKKFRVLIADDQILFRRGLVTLLAIEKDVDTVAEVSNLADAVALARSIVPDLLVMNVNLLENALEVEFDSLRQLATRSRVLFLGPEKGMHQPDLVARAGGSSLLFKSSTPSELVAGICRAFPSESQRVATFADTAADLQALARSSEGFGAPTALTVREKEVLKLLAEGLTVRETATVLSLRMKTVESHKLNLMRKLDIHDRPALIEFAARTRIIQPVNR